MGIWFPFAYMHCWYAMSKRPCAVVLEAEAFPAPMALPARSPPPAPIAAPAAGFPLAAPMAAPAAAPTAVPIAAPVIVLVVAACFGVVPDCWRAH